jgi:hypothetical protein
MITVHPKRKRPLPADYMVNTQFLVAEHSVTLSTALNQRPITTISIWQPAKPKELSDLMKTQFRRGKMKHAQKLADISQNTVSMQEEEP